MDAKTKNTFKLFCKAASTEKLLNSRSYYNKSFTSMMRQGITEGINTSSDILSVIWSELQKRESPCTIPA